jgi:hypothetical protein
MDKFREEHIRIAQKYWHTATPEARANFLAALEAYDREQAILRKERARRLNHQPWILLVFGIFLADNFPDSLLVAVFVIFTWLYFILWLAFVMPWLVGRKAGEIVSRHMH